MKHGTFLKTLALCLTAIMLLAMAIPALAEDEPFKNTAAQVTKDSIKFDKTLTMDDESIVTPNVTFTFNVTAGQAAAATEKTPAIIAGPVDTENKKPSASVTFATTDTHGTGETAVVKDVIVDFGSIAFTAPGVYRYVIVENDPNVAGVGIDTTTRYLDVYVQDKDGNGKLSVMDAVLHTNIAGEIGAAGTEENPNTNKDGGFFNTYGTQKLTLEKKVTGNQGDRAKLFKFIITITGANEKAEFTVKATSGLMNNAPEGEAANTGTKFAADADGNATGIYYLMDSDKIEILGLTEGTNYTIEEVLTDGEGYKTTATINGESAGVLDADSTNKRTTTEQTIADETDAVIYTNNREGDVPTGILLDVAPYALIVAIACAALVLLMRKRKTVQD